MSHSIEIRVADPLRVLVRRALLAVSTAVLFIVLAIIVVLVTWAVTSHPATDAQHRERQSPQTP